MKTEKTETDASPMVRTALFIQHSQMLKLKALSEVSGAPIAELCRRAISAYLESRKNEIPKMK